MKIFSTDSENWIFYSLPSFSLYPQEIPYPCSRVRWSRWMELWNIGQQCSTTFNERYKQRPTTTENGILNLLLVFWYLGEIVFLYYDLVLSAVRNDDDIDISLSCEIQLFFKFFIFTKISNFILTDRGDSLLHSFFVRNIHLWKLRFFLLV